MPFSPAVVVPPVLSPHPLWFVVHPRGLVLVTTPDGHRELPDTQAVRALGLDPANAHYLGQLDGEDSLAISLDQDPAAPLSVHGLRSVVSALDETRFFLAGRAGQILDWAATHRYCGRCMTETVRDAKERCVRCPTCALTAYPRISPAIIVLVRRGDEALLARSAKFPVPFFSTLAGFAEVGESLEETVAREVREEVAIEVTDIRYFGSQPWPFPNSLMIGFTANWAGGEIAVDGNEIAEASWFKADALPVIPPHLSIARRLIDAWLADVTS